ncbi:recombination regulator RecX [Streptococcus oricebi]|uniref:Regulatory protein RecX n=1 Tax=Streptococcus oricebi TaxID=1547447 RepID=A0ABS5B1Y3_9STRE|nr:recombination regulator RecX [Streptococcus oricebi]MBP2622839.1 recombination regulator RecX [Streptococcus oricebi]
MKITKLEKKKRLYLLELDHEESLYITEDTIVHFMLSRDKEVSPEELLKIQDYAQFSYGKNLALYYLSFKQRSKKEVRDYLVKHEISDKVLEQVLDKLSADRWIDDQKYSDSLIQSNLLSGDKGPYVLKQKLSQKGIKRSIIDKSLESHDFAPLASKVAEKLLKKYEKKLAAKALKDKILQSLVNKGFSYPDAQTAFEELTIEEKPEQEADLLYQELDKYYRKYSKKYQDYELKQRLTQALARKGFDFSDIASALREYF